MWSALSSCVNRIIWVLGDTACVRFTQATFGGSQRHIKATLHFQYLLTSGSKFSHKIKWFFEKPRHAIVPDTHDVSSHTQSTSFLSQRVKKNTTRHPVWLSYRTLLNFTFATMVLMFDFNRQTCIGIVYDRGLAH